ncbi:MAG: hypothetical protein JRH15_07315 [Deltaproteobacteria bacterium]|nr:hypothetical protein [Deltaproteobacteria bacterium]
MREQGVDVGAVPLETSTSAAYNGDLFRVDPHFYNNQEDIDRFLAGVDAFFNSR